MSVCCFLWEVVGQLRLAGPLDIVWTSPLLKQGHLESWLARNVSRWLFNIPKDGVYTISLGNVCQCLFALMMKKCSWHSERTSCVSECAHCLWSCHCAPLERAWLPPHCTLPSDIYTHKVLLEPTLLQAELFQLVQPFFIEMLQSLNDPLWPFIGFSLICPCLFY